MSIESTVQRIGKTINDAQEATTSANIPTNPVDYANALRERMIILAEAYATACADLGITPEHTIGEFAVPPNCPQ